jgi:PAS domain-containing protein
MPIVESGLAPLRNPRLAALATSARPAWLWSDDGSRILWANAVGAAIFGAATTSACTGRRFDVGDAPAAQIIRLAAAHPATAPERLERLRAHGGSVGRALTCACSRIDLPDGKSALLVTAVEAAGPTLPLAERVRRLLADDEQAWAGFALDGTLIYANAAALTHLRGAVTLPALGIETLAATALETGSARGTTRLADETVDVAAERLGTDDNRVLAVCLTPHASEIKPGQTAPAMSEQPPAAADPPREPAQSDPAPGPDIPAGPGDVPASASSPDGRERRHPLRFVWQMDADGRFSVGSDEFIELIGPHSLAGGGLPWHEIAEVLKLDPDDLVARAVATHETWSGLVVVWPIGDAAERLSVELSGLPVFDRDRNFRGYRGFGVCRDVERLNALAQAHRAQAAATPQTSPDVPVPEKPPIEATAVTSAQSAVPSERPPERPPLNLPAAAANVVPFRLAPAADAKPAVEPRTVPTLSPIERRAFRELAQELTARLRGETVESGTDGRQIDQTAAALARAAAVPHTVAEDVLLDRIPIGILIYRHDTLLHANRYFLQLTGHGSLDGLASAGGLHALFSDPATEALGQPDSDDPSPPRSLSIVTRAGERMPVDGRMVSVPWNGESALALILTNGRHNGAEAGQPATAGASAAVEQDKRGL